MHLPLFRRRLLISAACRLSVESEAVVVSTRDDSYRIVTSHPEEVQHYLRGLRSPAALLPTGSITASGRPEFEPVLAALHADYLLLDVDAAVQADTRERAAAALQHEARFWARPVFEHPFWEELLAGASTDAQVVGWGVEFYHFVDGANRYMPLGVANTRSFRHLRPAVARHYVEEMDHGSIFLEGLARCGVDRGSVLVAPPLPQTSALLNHLVELASEGEVPYAAAFSVMQPGFGDVSIGGLDAFYGRLAGHYPFAEGLFEAFLRHARIDIDLGHEETLLALLCRDAPGLAPNERARASLAMQTVAEAFTLFFEGVRSAYDGQRFFAPRRRLLVSVAS